jgi:hypothetical protein
VRGITYISLLLGLFACTGEADTDTDSAIREGLTDGGSYYVFWDSIPPVIPFNEQFRLSAMVHDGEDTTLMLTDRILMVDASMPAHDHGMETTPEVVMSESGVYTVNGMLFHMAGEWELEFAVSDGTMTERIHFTIDCCEQ